MQSEKPLNRIAEDFLEPKEGMDVCHAAAMCDKLEQNVVPCFYKDRGRLVDIMRHRIAIDGSFFNMHRMLAQYMNEAYSVVDSYFGKVIQHE